MSYFGFFAMTRGFDYSTQHVESDTTQIPSESSYAVELVQRSEYQNTLLQITESTYTEDSASFNFSTSKE